MIRDCDYQSYPTWLDQEEKRQSRRSTREETLREHLTDEQWEQARQVAQGDKDLILDYPDLYDLLFQFYMSEMPYGTAKARTGDPVQWLQNRLEQEIPR